MNSLRYPLPAVLLCALAWSASARGAADTAAGPYESAFWPAPANAVDAAVGAALAERGAVLRPPCSDGVFLRRVHLDMTGTLPTFAEAEAFLKDARPGKRAALVESLFLREEFADYASMKWCDLLRVKSEFPINLWPNAVQAYHRWVRDAVRSNMPYDGFARALLTSSGSNFRVPPVNFYRALPARDPASIAGAAALTFLGARFERWPEERRRNVAALFSRVAYKKTLEWKEEIVLLKPDAAGPLIAALPDGTQVTVPEGADPREAFADWLITPENPWFSRNIVNRIWAWTMGTGVIEEPDDIREDNPPACPQVLSVLESELVRSGWDLRAVYRLILGSRTYQQSSIPRAGDAAPGVRFARYGVRRMEAEVLIDALCRIGGDGESYSSAIPEPFTFTLKGERTTALADGSITSPFLARFGRSPRDTGRESERGSHPTEEQVLYLLNSSDVRRRLEGSPPLAAAYGLGADRRAEQVRRIYVTLLSRPPTVAESAAAERYLAGRKQGGKKAAVDLAWALLNGKEFLYKH